MRRYERSFAVGAEGTTESVIEARQQAQEAVLYAAGDARRGDVVCTLWGTTNAVLNLAGQGIEVDAEVEELCRVFPHRTLVMATVEVEV